MTSDRATSAVKAAKMAALLSVLPLAALLAGCGLARFGDSQEASGPDRIHTDAAPIRSGWVLVLKDGDLRLLAGHWERQITDTGDYWTGALTRDGSVIGLRRVDGGGSSLVRLEVGETSITKTAEFPLSWELPDRGSRHGYLVVSPDAEHVLVGHLLIGLNSGQRTQLVPGGCCDVWSPDGSHIAYLARAGDWDPDSLTVRRFDLWVAPIAGVAAPRRIATDLMRSSDLDGRHAESIAWSSDGKSVLALLAAGAEWIELRGPGYGVAGPANNRLVRIDVDTGEELVLANSADLHRRLSGEVDLLADQVVVSAPATSRDGERAAFLVMDYEHAYGIGLLDAGGRLERLVVEMAPDRHTVT